MATEKTTLLCFDQYNATSELIARKSCGCYYSSIVKLNFLQNGIAHIYYDISQFETFSIVVANESCYDMSAYLGLSPNGMIFETDESLGTQIINPGRMAIFPGVIFINYTSVYVNAVKGSEALVYFQGQYKE